MSYKKSVDPRQICNLKSALRYKGVTKGVETCLFTRFVLIAITP